MRRRQTALDSGADCKRVTSPCEEGIPLSNLPVGSTIEVKDRERGIGRFGCDQGGDGRGRGYALIEEGHAEKGVADGGEEA